MLRKGYVKVGLNGSQIVMFQVENQIDVVRIGVAGVDLAGLQLALLGFDDRLKAEWTLTLAGLVE